MTESPLDTAMAALRTIAAADWRGNEPESVTAARTALAAIGDEGVDDIVLGRLMRRVLTARESSLRMGYRNLKVQTAELTLDLGIDATVEEVAVLTRVMVGEDQE